MDKIETYKAELDKLDKLEFNYWRQWAACDQEERKNLKYLDGVRWCMTHRLKLLAKLEKLEAAEAATNTKAPATKTEMSPEERQATQQEAANLHQQSEALHARVAEQMSPPPANGREH